MKYVVFALLIGLIVSCNETLVIVSTGEKVSMDVSPYVVGDTVMLYNAFGEWRMDINWTILTDTTTCRVWADSSLTCLSYRRAAVVK